MPEGHTRSLSRRMPVLSGELFSSSSTRLLTEIASAGRRGELLDIGPAFSGDARALTKPFIPIGNAALRIAQQHGVVGAFLKALVSGNLSNARFGDRAGSP